MRTLATGDYSPLRAVVGRARRSKGTDGVTKSYALSTGSSAVGYRGAVQCAANCRDVCRRESESADLLMPEASVPAPRSPVLQGHRRGTVPSGCLLLTYERGQRSGSSLRAITRSPRSIRPRPRFVRSPIREPRMPPHVRVLNLEAALFYKLSHRSVGPTL